MGNRRIILELDREPQDLQAVWRLDSIARLIQQALNRQSIPRPPCERLHWTATSN